MRAMVALFLSLAGAPALARDPIFDLPIACDLGTTCHIQQFVDHDSGPGASDFACGTLSYDGHKGTDFALPSLAAQSAGVDVLATAPGTVTAIRDELPDILQGTPGAPDITNLDCGNGVVVNHGDGWETQYCHMALGSIAVQPGQTVAMGTVLGQVGLSGNTQFPHLHLSVRHNGAVIDPFDPDGAITCGAPSTASLWLTRPDTPAGGAITAGFSTGVPDYADVKAGTVADTLGTRVPLVLWAYFFGSQAGDTVTLTITGPEGEVFTTTDPLDRGQAQFFRAGGKRAPPSGWATGTYTGTATLARNGTVIDTIVTQTTLN